MLNQFSRTELLFGKAAMEKMASSRVAVFGIGGVGGYTCEALVRSGVGAFDLIDDDKVCLTNLNRQIIATRKTVGKYKAEVMKERMLEINPDVKVEIHKCFFLPENADEFPFEDYDYIVDAGTGNESKRKRSSHHQLHGCRKQIRSHHVPCSRYLQNKSLPAGKSYAPGAEKKRRKEIKGGLLRGAAYKTDQRYGHQLQKPLHLPARCGS